MAPEVGIASFMTVTLSGEPIFSRIKWVNGDIVRIGYHAGEGYVPGVGNINSVYVGNLAGEHVTTGAICAFGQEAAHNTTSGVADCFGDGAGLHNMTGYVAAFGHGAADGNIDGNIHAFGYHALFNSQHDIGACAFGYEAALANNGGLCNAFGYQSLLKNTTGNANAFGYLAGANNLTGNICAFGHYAVAAGVDRPFTGFGYYSLREKLSGSGTAIGSQSGQNSIDGQMTAIGYLAGFTNTHGGVYVGHLAGAYEDADESFYIDNMDRGSKANGRIQSLLYGLFNANPVLQTLWINAQLNILLGAVVAAANNAAAALAGVPVGGLYRINADPSILCIRSA